MKRIILIVFSVIFTANAALYSEESGNIVVNGKVVFQIGGNGALNAAARAKAINSRIQKLLSSGRQMPSVQAKQVNKEWVLVSGDFMLMTVTEIDSLELGTIPEKLAQHWADLLNEALAPTSDKEKVVVRVYGREFLSLVSTERALASERAELARARIRSVIKDRISDPVKVEIRDRRYVITRGDRALITVSHEDAVNNHTTVPELARIWAAQLQTAIDQAIQERTRQYLIEVLKKSLGALGGLLLALWVLVRLHQFLLAKLENLRRKALEKETIEFGGLIALQYLISSVYWSSCLLLVCLCAYYVMQQVPYTRDYVDSSISILKEGFDVLQRVFETTLFPLGSTQVSLKTILFITFFIALVIWLGRRTKRFLEERLLIHWRMDQGHAQALSTVVNYLIILIGFIIVLRLAGLDLSALTVFGGAVGIGIGFGMQNIANNFVSGLIILFERPIQVGDRVEIGNIVGDVVKISARSTTILTNDNIAVIVPNSNFVSSTVTNWSHLGDRRVRFKVKFSVAQNSDVKLVEKALLEAANDHPDVLKNPKPSVRFMNFADNGLDFELRVWTVKLSNRPGELRSDLNFAIVQKFKDYNIESPYPQRDLHIRSAVPLEARIIERGPLQERDKEIEEILKETPER